MATTSPTRRGTTYPAATRLLHWLTVLALAGQFAVGWTMADDAGGTAADRAEARLDAFEERGEDAAEQRGEAAEERFEAEVERREDAIEADEDASVERALRDVTTLRLLDGGMSSAEVHVLLGLCLLALGAVRVVRRRVVALPPWAEHLSGTERSVEGLLERAMLVLLLVVPLTGLAAALGPEGLLAAHVVAQVAVLAAVGSHVALVLWHTVVRRNRHLARML